MSAIIIAQKVESSGGDRPSKYEQTHKLMLICSDGPKKAIRENSNLLYCLLTEMNRTYFKYTWQRQQGQHCGFQFLILILNSIKDSVYFISTGKISEIFGPK